MDIPSSHTQLQLSTNFTGFPLPMAIESGFKILILTFKSIHGSAPPYLSNLIKVNHKSSYALRSNNILLLAVPHKIMPSTLGGRYFTFAAPAPWNSLPADLCVVTTLCAFKGKLKTSLFRSAFHNYFLFINIFNTFFFMFH